MPEAPSPLRRDIGQVFIPVRDIHAAARRYARLLGAAGVDEDVEAALTADATSGTTIIAPDLHAPAEQYIGGFTIIDVADDADAAFWGGRLAEACGWPQQIRRVY